MYSLNVPVPNEVRRLATDLEPELTAFDQVRDRHTLVVKRLDGEASRHRLRERTADTLAGVGGFEARIDRIEQFETPPTGTAPVVYLAVESPGLLAVHDRLVAAFGAVDGLEGDDYTPHVTLARGYDGGFGSVGGGIGSSFAAVLSPGSTTAWVGPVEWTVDELGIWNREYEEIVTRISLPP
ncbi:MAG: 2'-5' RNA ligase family protein [Halobaculum sp.]